MNAQETDRFIYIVGEQHNGILAESAEVLSFVQDAMAHIVTGELALVIANVFARGQLFPGPDGALTSVIHAFLARSGRYEQAQAHQEQGRCTLVTAFKRLDGEISVKVSAVMPVQPGQLAIEQPAGFHRLLLEHLPDFQNAFTEEAYAPDSKLIGIIKETTLHHIQAQLK